MERVKSNLSQNISVFIVGKVLKEVESKKTLGVLVDKHTAISIKVVPRAKRKHGRTGNKASRAIFASQSGNIGLL